MIAVTVYSNLGEPILYLNGKKVTAKPLVKDVPVHYVFENIQLKKGKNILKVISSQNKQEYTDTITWNLK